MEENKVNICGLLSLIFSILSWFILGIPCSIAGIVLGIVGCTKENKALAIIGTIISIIALIVVCIGFSILY